VFDACGGLSLFELLDGTGWLVCLFVILFVFIRLVLLCGGCD